MRIDLNQAVPPAPDSAQAGGAGKSGAGSGVGNAAGADSAKLSSTQTQIKSLAAQVGQLPELRQEKIAALAQALRGSNYPVNSGQTAEALIAHMASRSA